jgi:hypothetical protein
LSIINRIRQAHRDSRGAPKPDHEHNQFERSLAAGRSPEAGTWAAPGDGETYAEAMARLTGADPATFEPETTWAALPEEERLEYLADRAAELSSTDDGSVQGAALDRMVRDGAPEAQIEEARAAGGAWRATAWQADGEALRASEAAWIAEMDAPHAVREDQAAAVHERWLDPLEPAMDPDGPMADGRTVAEPQTTAAGQLEYDSSRCDGYAVPDPAAAGHSFMGAPVPEEASADAHPDAQAEETPDPRPRFAGNWDGRIRADMTGSWIGPLAEGQGREREAGS